MLRTATPSSISGGRIKRCKTTVKKSFKFLSTTRSKFPKLTHFKNFKVISLSPGTVASVPLAGSDPVQVINELWLLLTSISINRAELYFRGLKWCRHRPSKSHQVLPSIWAEYLQGTRGTILRNERPTRAQAKHLVFGHSGAGIKRKEHDCVSKHFCFSLINSQRQGHNFKITSIISVQRWRRGPKPKNRN